MFRNISIAVALSCVLGAQALSVPAISATSLQKHVEYLASDKLQGRGNPSPGLDAAAEYIAAQFWKIGLEPAAGSDFLQPVDMELLAPDVKHFSFRIEGHGQTIRVTPDEVLLLQQRGLDLDRAQIFNVRAEDGQKTEAPASLRGKVVMIEIGAPRAKWMAHMDELGPELVLSYGPNAAKVNAPGLLVIPGTTVPEKVSGIPIRTDKLREILKTIPSGLTELRATLHLRRRSLGKSS